MIRSLLNPGLALLIAGCASTPETLEKSSKTIPAAWAQQPEEKGSMLVGRVVAIGRYHGYEVRIAPHHEPQLKDALLPVVITVGLFAGPVIMALSEVGAEPLALHKPLDRGENVYRHSIQRNGTDDIAVRDEFWPYSIGDSVALRAEPEMLVPALPDACE